MESVDGKPFDALFAADGIVVEVTDNLWEFEPDGVWFANPVLTISNDVDGSIFKSKFALKLAGIYTLEGDRYNLTTSFGFLIDFGFKDPDGDTGTWARVNDRLVLTSDYGTLAVFRESDVKY